MTMILMNVSAKNSELVNRPINAPYYANFEKDVIAAFSQFHYAFRLPKTKEYICSHCGHTTVNENKFKQGDLMMCEKCWNTLRVYNLRSNTNYSDLKRNGVVELYQRYGNEFLMRKYFCTVSYNRYQADYTLSIAQIALTDGKNIIKWKKDYENYWQGELKWVKSNYGTLSMYQTYTVYKLYTEPFADMILNSDVRYSKLDIAVLPERFELENIVTYRKYPFIENLWKSGMTELVRGYLNDAPGKIETRCFLKHHRAFMKGKNPTMRDLSELRQVQKVLDWVNLDILWNALKSRALTYNWKYEMTQVVENDNQVPKLLKYLTKQRTDIRQYHDYIRMMKQMGADTERYPKDFKESHDRATQRFNSVKLELNQAKYDEIKPSLDGLKFYSMGYVIAPPDTLAEIVQEGQTLSHCVGSYIERVVNNETNILFVRKVQALDKPFYTLEFKDGRVVQCRGYKNESMTPEVQMFVDTWLNQIHKQESRAAA